MKSLVSPVITLCKAGTLCHIFFFRLSESQNSETSNSLEVKISKAKVFKHQNPESKNSKAYIPRYKFRNAKIPERQNRKKMKSRNYRISKHPNPKKTKFWNPKSLSIKIPKEKIRKLKFRNQNPETSISKTQNSESLNFETKIPRSENSESSNPETEIPRLQNSKTSKTRKDKTLKSEISKSLSQSEIGTWNHRVAPASTPN